MSAVTVASGVIVVTVASGVTGVDVVTVVSVLTLWSDCSGWRHGCDWSDINIVTPSISEGLSSCLFLH